MKKVFAVLSICAVALFSYLAFTSQEGNTVFAMGSKGPAADSAAAASAGKTYSGTVYVAGMGGHFAKADVTIDPSNANQPIKMNALDRIVIGEKKTHPTHDARIDAKDRDTMFWSTYVLDPDGKMHVGKSDLKTGNVIKDLAMTPDPKSAGTKPPLYCASGQSKDFYMPVFMGTEGYVDVLDKKDLSLKHRVWVSDLGYAKGTYKFVHGINSPDMKTFVLAINQAKEGKGTGDVDFILVDMKALENGKFKQVRKNTLKGEPEKTLTFRQYFSNDGKRIYQSAADRLWVIDANTLEKVDEQMMPEGSQLHDVQTTADDKYAILAVRSVTEGCDVEGKAIVKDGQTVDITDGVIMLYDAGAKKVSDKSVSACLECHKGMGLGDKNAVLCGLDSNWKK